MEQGAWSQLWLAYEKRQDRGAGAYVADVALNGFSGEHRTVKRALEELQAGIRGMLGIEGYRLRETAEATLVLKRGTGADQEIQKEGFCLLEKDGVLTVEAADESGLLYGVAGLLRLIAMEKSLAGICSLSNPSSPLRMYDHWDNMDGSIERGYSGHSFFFRENEVLVDGRTRDYARLVSSVGINGVVINNVNVKQAATWLITDRYLDKVRELAELFEDYGIRLFLAVNYASPIELGGLESADPLDLQVQGWWRDRIAQVYQAVPSLGGFLVKADSEGRPGPFTYGRTQADGANMLARLVEPYGGLILWRCFVYNCTQDWRDRKTDRAKAGYDSFIGQDGDYLDNVILQIKNGPMDFQIREPVSPLFGGMRKTNQMLEVQVAQEYTGQQIDVCYLIPLFREVLDFDTYCQEDNALVSDIISGRTFGNQNTGIAAVCNTGDDFNWTGSDLAAANFYGFGRLAFCHGLTAEEIAEEWIRLTLSNEEEVVRKVKKILLCSREVYEKYTSPLGIGWMVTPNTHYGCSVDGYEYSRWGTYHRADHLGIGVDRSMRGTGYAGQYQKPNAERYDSLQDCPEELLLFFHRVPYLHRLKSGKTLIQHIYDTHFEGVEEVEEMIALWESLKESISGEVYDRVRERMDRQLENAREWRDQVNAYFYRKSGIPDEKGREIY